MKGTVAITGATGYLGGLLSRRFAEEGWEVVRLVRLPSTTTDRRFFLGEALSAETSTL